MSGAVCAILTSAQDLAANLSPTSLGGSKSGKGVVQTSSAVTVTARGGRLPYSYAWTYVSGSATPSADDPTARTTKFSVYALPPATYTCTFKCVVTDGNATVVDSPTVEITLESY